MYTVTLRDVAVEDFDKLDGSVQKQALKQFEKLAHSPEVGAELGHRMGVDLTGYRTLHFHKNQYRIVYRILGEQGEVEIWGIGVRESGRVYRMTSRRVEKEG